MSQMINWHVEENDRSRIMEIAKRAETLAKKHGVELSRRDLMMDLTACHANGNPLDLPGLQMADDGNFGHDVFGINRHIDRNTGKLLHCFVPRYSQRVAA